MSWYSDQPPSGPPPGGQPPGGPPPATPPPFPQQTPPPGGQTGGGNKSRTIAIVAVVGLLALVVGAGAFGAFLLLGGPEELSMSRYSSSFCDDALKEHGKKISKLIEDRDFERAYEGEVKSESKAAAAIEAHRLLLDEVRATADSIAGFNDSFVLRGSDGADFRTDFADAIKDYKSDLDVLAKDMKELDPADEEDAVEDLVDLWSDAPQIDIDTNPDEIGGELAIEMMGEHDDCTLVFGMTTDLSDYYEAGGDGAIGD